MTKLLYAAASGLALALAAPADAAAIRYILSGTFTGTLAGDDVSGAVTFTGLADTDDATGTFFTFVPLSRLSVVAGGTTYDVRGNPTFYLVSGSDLAGIFTDDGGFDFASPAFAGYDGISRLAPVAVDFFGGSVTTDRGTLALQADGPVTFAAAFVPEPATWGLMALGFGLTGLSLRRRARPPSAHKLNRSRFDVLSIEQVASYC